jgi:hypothetical protein
MPNDFIGDLSKARLLELVGPLLSGKKSGMVLIKGEEVGELHLEGGSIVHAKTGASTGEEAILAMMEWENGRATFDWEATAPERTVYMPTEQLVQSWTNREKEWKKIREVISSVHTSFRIPLDGNPGDKNVKATEWKVLALCDGTRTVGDIARTLNWHIFETCKLVHQMVGTGLIEKASEKPVEKEVAARRTVNGNFFPFIENELRKIMGPMAPIILDDKIAELGESKDAFPEDMVQPFVQAVGEEITHNAKRALFTKAMTEFFAQMQH